MLNTPRRTEVGPMTEGKSSDKRIEIMHTEKWETPIKPSICLLSVQLPIALIEKYQFSTDPCQNRHPTS